MEMADKRYAVVTGAGSGLGHATAKMMSENGWEVFGTVFPGKSTGKLVALGITPVPVDISDEVQVERAREFVEDKLGGSGLAALINVAGIAGPGGGLIEGISAADARKTIETNLLGTINMVRSFLPLLRAYGPARIVNVASTIETPAVFTGVYLVSKFGVEGLTNVLRYEMAPFGIQATSIDPAGMKTPMTQNAEENTRKNWDRMGKGVRDAYYDKISPSLEFINKNIENAEEPEEMAKVIMKALNDKKMKIRYGSKQNAWMEPVIRLLGEDRFERMMMKGMKLV